ncbi:MAG TPA: cobalamin-independent methionine synthase II family protein [Candidatus Binataceae bacterium]|nr:cobalamin-independent methionine synthase II family protein [Candidatus Binataceae bacterium]HVB81684.1 cobalamin-independent methionine synthase II family protein [Candidatus Binataceae bacterium]
MKRSTQRILTTHAGSLPRPDDLIALNVARLSGNAYDERAYSERLASAVADICRRQAELGIDVINDGEFGKATRGPVDYGAWQSYAWGRISGWEYGPVRDMPQTVGRRDRVKFADFYRELNQNNQTSTTPMSGRPQVVTAPITFTGHDELRVDLENFKAALGKVRAEEGFITSIAPGSLGRRQNEYYKSDEEYLFAMAEALREEYRAIVEAGFVLQLDDPGLADTWDLANPEPTVAEYRKFAMVRIEALNHGLRGLPEDRIRYHICWGSWHGPHSTDLPLKDIGEVMLKVRAGAFSVEAGNVRHEHEWKLWRDGLKLPDGKLLIPGVVSHATNVVEHPEVVADRILRYAEVVGRENVIAGTDCGLGGRIHPQLVWAKLEALVAGAEIASRQLWR